MESDTVWRALASSHRRHILETLREGPKTTGDIWKEMPELSRFAVMQHLGVLEEAGLVLFRRDGRKRFNYSNPAPLREIYERWVEPRASSAAEAVLHLKRYAEKPKELQAMSDSEYRLVKLEMEMRIRAPREKVFAALTTDYDKWWPHRFKADSTCYVEARPGGAIGERFSNGGGAVTSFVVYVDPPFKLASSCPSALGKGSDGFTSETLIEDGEETIYRRESTMWGSVSEETEKMYRDGARHLMEVALRGYVEDGVGYSKGDAS